MRDDGMRRTSLDMPANLWARIKKRAIDEGRGAREVVIDALQKYLADPPKRKEAKR